MPASEQKKYTPDHWVSEGQPFRASKWSQTGRMGRCGRQMHGSHIPAPSPVRGTSAFAAVLTLTGLLRRKKWAIGISLLTLLVLLISAALPVLLPIPNIPEVSGSYPVGTTTLTLTDTARTEIYSGKDEPRQFLIQIWYPADPRPGDNMAPWVDRIDIYGPAISRIYHMPPFFLDHLALLKTPAYQNSTLAKADGKFPIAIFSHGWTGFAAQNTGQAIELASNGYLVVGMHHTYGAVVTVFPDGTVASYNPDALPSGVSDEEYLVAARKLVNQWSGDISFALDTLTELNADPASMFYDRLDFDRIGVYGHSTGGGAAIEFCGTDARCKTVFGMDPFMTPVSEFVMENGVSQPAFFIFSEAWHADLQSKNNLLFDGFYAHLSDIVGVAYVEGSRHSDFGDLPMLSPIAAQLGLKGPISGGQMTKINFAYLLQFMDLELKGTTTHLFDGPSAQFPEVKFFTPSSP